MRTRLAVLCAAAVALGLVIAPATASARPSRPAAQSGALTWQAPRHSDPLRGLTSISCVSKTSCRAGDRTDRVVRWDGHHWQPGYQFPADARGIYDMTCTSTQFCAAAEIINQPDGIAYRPVTRNADGAWNTSSPATLLTRGRYGIAQNFAAGALSCTSASFCILANQQQGFQRWNGTSWTAPVQFEKTHFPTYVSCASPTMCEAVEDGEGQKSFYRWNGTAWSGAHVVDANHHARGVSCPTTSFCMVVLDGYYVTVTGSHVSALKRFGTGQYATSVSCTGTSFCIGTSGFSSGSLRWDGSTWSGPHKIAGQSGLRVSCASRSFCAAVSDQGDAVHRVDGAWQAPRTVEQLAGYPSDVSCGSPQPCVLVDSESATLAYDGTSWSGPHRIAPHTPRSVVSCVSDAFCAAGTYIGAVQFRRDGHWSAPQRATVHEISTVQAISCTSSKFCAILTDEGAFRVWNGSRWFTIATPTDYNFATGLSCVAGGCVVTVPIDGFSGHLEDQTWIYRTGAKSLKKVGPHVSHFESLSCVSLTFCMADTDPDGAPDIMQQFDGTSWHSAPTAAGPVNGFDVSCASTTLCVTVAGRSESTWDGTRWGAKQEIVDAPLGPNEYLNAVSCRPTVCAATTTEGWTVVAE